MSSGSHLAASLEPDAADVVAVRRNSWLSGVVAALAALVGLGYLVRGSNLLDTVMGVVLLLLATLHAAALGSARTPVLVADEQGIRLRVGLTWRGIPWGSVRQVVVEHADNPLREGRLVVVPRDPRSTTEHLGWLSRTHLRWNGLWYGAALSVPLGMTTLTDSTDLGADLTRLADGRTDVVYLRGRQLAQLDDVVSPARTDELPVSPGVAENPRHALESEPEPDHEPGPVIPVEPEAGTHAEAEPDAGLEDEAVAESEPEAAEPPVPPLPEPVAPLRALNHPSRVEVRLDTPALANDESGREPFVPAQRSPDDVVPVPDLVHTDAWEELPVEIEVEDLAVHAPIEPVIGPRIAHARQRLAMTVEELSERTRIRPHVIEAIEVDDFAPCGGDFYARGHLTAIARVLGLEPDPLVKEYDDRYAGGPINARRVFEAELATGLSSGMRATRGGPSWTLLIGAVLCLTMVWGVARLVAGDPAPVTSAPVSTSDSAGLAANHQPITSPLMKTTSMTVTAAHAGAHVIVRDRTGRILWSGDLPMTHRRQVVGLAPFRVEADNAGAIEVTVAGEPRGTLGMAGQAGARRFQ